MKIELYLANIDQDFIKIAKSVAKAPKPPKPLPPCVYASWKKSCCVANCVTAREKHPHIPIVAKRPIPCLFMRAEPDGGLIWDSKTGAVYKVDQEAYEALGLLDNGVPPRNVAKSLGLPFSRVNTFVAKIRKLGT